MKRYLVLTLALTLISSVAWAQDTGTPDTVYFVPASMASANGETLYVPPGLLPWDVEIDAMAWTDAPTGISGVTIPLVDLCYDAVTMPTYLDSMKNQYFDGAVTHYLWAAGGLIEFWDVIKLNLYGVGTPTPPNFLVGGVAFAKKFDPPGGLIAHLTFTVNALGCICLDSIPGFDPGAAKLQFTTPIPTKFTPQFKKGCFEIAECRPCKTCPEITPDQYLYDGFVGDVVAIGGGLFDAEGDNVIGVTAGALNGCGTIEGMTFNNTRFDFNFNTAGGTPCADGIIDVEITATDEFAATCYDTVQVELIGAAAFVIIDQIDFSHPGDIVYLPVLLANNVKFGGFKLLIEWDPTVLTLHDVSRGDCIDAWDFMMGPDNPHYLFEKFYYEQLPCTDIHKKKVKLVGIHDMPDGYQGYPIEPTQDSCVLAYLKFEVKNDATLKGFKLPVRFEWDDGIYDENTFSDPTGWIWYVSADPDQFPYDTTGPNVEIEKVVCFTDGGIRVDDTGVAWRGDVNLNEFPYEIADAVCFANYFITEYLCTYGMVSDYWYEISINATDVNNDGITLSIADLVYLIRIILELETPMGKISPSEEVATINTEIKNNILTISSSSEVPVGAIRFVFEHKEKIEIPKLSSDLDMELKYHDSDGKLNLLVWSLKGNSIPSGTKELCRIETKDEIELVKVEASDNMGRILNTIISSKPKVFLPKDFALAQNYPNPFNPVTKIAFALPEPCNVELKIYNITGQLVKSYDKWFEAGEHTINWDGKNENGNDVASGVYFYRIVAGKYSSTKKMVLMR